MTQPTLITYENLRDIGRAMEKYAARQEVLMFRRWWYLRKAAAGRGSE